MAVTTYPSQGSVRPSVTVTVNSDGMAGTAANSQKKLALIGYANGGIPGTVYTIDSFLQAKRIFRSGDLLDAIEVAFSPNSTVSSGQILAERVGESTQATLDNKGVKFTSALYGADANKIQIGLSNNTLNQTKTLRVVSMDDNYDVSYTNLGNIFNVAYDKTVGGAAYADIEVKVDDTTKLATSLVLRSGADAASATIVQEFTLGTGAYERISALIGGISQIQGFQAHYNSFGSKNIETKYLDVLAVTPLTTTALTLTSIGGDIVNILPVSSDTTYGDIVYATYDPSKGEPEVTSLTNMTGATTDNSVLTTWSKYLNNMTNEEGYYLVPLTDDVAIQSEAVAFVESQVANANPRAVIVGGGINETAQQSLSRASLLRTKSSKVVVNAASTDRLMNSGVVKPLPAYVVAAQIAGIASGIGIGESVMQKQIDAVNVHQKFDKDTLDLLDSEGIISIEFVRNGSDQVFRVTDDVTTARPLYDESNIDPIVVYLGTGEASDFLVTRARHMLEATYLGSRTSEVTAKDIKTSMISFLLGEVNAGELQSFSESGITVVVQGNQATISATDIVLAQNLRKINLDMSYVNEIVTA